MATLEYTRTAGDSNPLEVDETPPPKVPTERIVRDPGQAYLAVCLGVKDQNEDLREWIEYHQSIGVGKFYISDDNSSVPAADMLPDLIQEGEQSSRRQAEMHMILNAPSEIHSHAHYIALMLSPMSCFPPPGLVRHQCSGCVCHYIAAAPRWMYSPQELFSSI